MFAGFFRHSRPAPEPQPPSAARETGSRDDRFDALVRALPLGVIMLNGSLRIRFANRAAAAIFGFSRSRSRGMHLIEAAPNIELERRAQAALRGELANGPLLISGKTLSRTYAVSVYPLGPEADHEHEEVTGVLVLAEDQTELLALERARQEFLTNASHELRTPLASIRLMLETVMESDDAQAKQTFLPQALAQVDRLAALVQRLLDQARVESGKLVLQLRALDLEAVAKPIVASFEKKAAAIGVNLHLHSQGAIEVEADEPRLQQIFVNLIDNALRYTAQGGTVRVELEAREREASITVSDTGIGIPYRDIPHVFERFYVVDRARARDGGGAGLGLSIVKEIVEAHGGTVRVDSVLGSSTRFTVLLPLRRGSA